MTDPTVPGDLEELAGEVARDAAALIRAAVGTAQVAGSKSSATDVVTATDLAAERLIRDQLTARCPGSRVMAEEEGGQLATAGVGWIVDPLDGNVNFLYDLPVRRRIP